MSVQSLDCGCDGESSCKSSGTELSSSTTGGENGADRDIFDEAGVDLGALDEGLEGTEEEIGSGGVLEATLSTLGDGCAESASYDDLDRVSAHHQTGNLHRKESVIKPSSWSLSSTNDVSKFQQQKKTHIIRILLQKARLSLPSLLRRTKMISNLREALLS